MRTSLEESERRGREKIAPRGREREEERVRGIERERWVGGRGEREIGRKWGDWWENRERKRDEIERCSSQQVVSCGFCLKVGFCLKWVLS